MRPRAAALVLFAVLCREARAEPVAQFPELDTARPRSEPRPPTTAPPREPSPATGAPSIPTELPGEAKPAPGAGAPRPFRLPSGAEELADRGRRLEEAQHFAQAITAYTESIQLDPTRGETLLALGKLRARLGETKEAEFLLSSAARFESVAAEALTARAHLRKAEGRTAEATSDLERAVRISPGDPACTDELSALYVARGAWPSALALWRRRAADSRDADADRRTKLQVRALTVLAAELDPVVAGGGPGYSWARHAFAKIAAR